MKLISRKNFSSESEDDYYEIKRAPMMMLLPGSRPQDVTSSPTPVSKKISDATQSSVKTEDEEESEYTYETGKLQENMLCVICQCVYRVFFNFRFPLILITTKNSHFWVSVGIYSTFFSHNTLPPTIHLAQMYLKHRSLL